MTMGGTAPDAKRPAGRRRATTTRGGALRAPGLPRPSLQSKGWRYTLIGATATLLVAWLAWYAATPEKLPVSDRSVNASGVAGKPLFLGMFVPPDDYRRTIRVSGVKVHATSNQPVRITPLLCRRGTIGVTTDPDQFCAELVDPSGERLTDDDSIVLRVDSDDPAVAVIDRIRIGYREDIRWDTQHAGYREAIVSIAGRPAGD